MNINRIWSAEMRKVVYFIISQELGSFNDTWRGSKPANVPVREMNEMYDRIFEKISQNFDRTPKSPAAIAQQVAWALTTQNPYRLDANQRKLQSENRMAAYEAGFLTFSDIFRLEQQAFVRAESKIN